MQTTKPSTSLHGSHLRTYEKIFQHPISHNLPWRDVLALFSHIGDVMVEPNGNLRVSRHGHTLILPAPCTKDVAEVDELMKLRHFLEQSDTPRSESDEAVALMLVVIDHHQARLFRVEKPDTAPEIISNRETHELFRHAHDARDYFTGKEKPTPNVFFTAVAEALKNSAEILLFGTGSGASSEMALFAAWLKKHRPDQAVRLIGSHTINEHHLTEAQLLAQARELLANPRGS